MIRFLLLDLDDTVLDFHKSEQLAIEKTLREFGMEPTEAVCALYSRINQEHWERLERKELTRQQVITGRFTALFSEFRQRQTFQTYASNTRATSLQEERA